MGRQEKGKEAQTRPWPEVTEAVKNREKYEGMRQALREGMGISSDWDAEAPRGARSSAGRAGRRSVGGWFNVGAVVPWRWVGRVGVGPGPGGVSPRDVRAEACAGVAPVSTFKDQIREAHRAGDAHKLQIATTVVVTGLSIAPRADNWGQVARWLAKVSRSGAGPVRV